VILGVPGAGKSTLLYELTTLLLTKDDGDSIPVPFELPAWTARQLPLEEFLAAELGRRYGVGGSLARRWVAAEVVIPMLDGLDEVPASHRSACVERINGFRKAHPRVNLVVACREAEYGELGLGVEARSAVVVQTLGRKEVEDYLASAVFFDGLIDELEAAPELWELMTTPLMLWVAAYAFERDGAGDLGTVADVRAALFDRFVDRMLVREAMKPRAAGPAFSAEDTRRWLGETAAAMGRVGVTSFHLEDLSVDWLPEANRPSANRQLRWVGGLVTDSVSERSAANSGLKQSGIYAALCFIFPLIPAIGLARVAGFEAEVSSVMGVAALGIAIAGPAVAFVKGGAFCIWNLMLRYVLARGGYTPWRYTTFLHHAVERVIMIRQGGSFRFLQRMLQEHLAAGAGSARPATR
jgi:hypothetical protein